MAKGQRAVGPITVWMIIFVALWLTSTVFLVVLYTGQEELRSRNEQLQAANSRLISPAQERSLELFRNAQPGGPTVVGLLNQARGDTAFLATGNEDDDSAAVRAKRDQLVETIRSDGFVSDPDTYEDASLFEAFTMLYAAYKADNAHRRAAEERAEALDTEVARLVQVNADQKADFDGRAQEFAEQLGQVEESHAAYRAQRPRIIVVQRVVWRRRTRCHHRQHIPPVNNPIRG